MGDRAMRKALWLAALFALAPSLAWGQAALRPDQIKPGTPDITTGMVGNQFHIGTTIPWRTISGATVLASEFSKNDNATVIELTFPGVIDVTLPGTIGDFADGAGFALQVGPGALTLHAGSGSSINGEPTIHVGSFQSVGLASRSGHWYASLSLPQPQVQNGSTVLADNMQWLTGGGLGPPGVAECPEGTAFIARADTFGPPLDDPHKTAYMTLICGLKKDGVWDKLDALYMLATVDQPRANLNLVSSNFTLVPQGPGAIQFNANEGYDNGGFNGDTSIWIDTQFNPTVGSGHKYTLNEAHIFVWSRSPDTLGSSTYPKSIGASNTALTAATFIVPFGVDAFFRCAVNVDVNASSHNIAAGGSSGGWLCQTTGGNTSMIYRNGLPLDQAATPVTAMPNVNFYLLNWNVEGTGAQNGGPWQISSASIGSSLTASQIGTAGTQGSGLMPRVCAFLVAVGSRGAC